nr:reverse transcriptase domain-containing protein [Tanacetum cinerariifolium]
MHSVSDVLAAFVINMMTMLIVRNHNDNVGYDTKVISFDHLHIPPAYPQEIISGSTTTRFDISLPEYEASYDDQSFSDEDVPEKIFSKPLFEEEIIPMKMDQHYYNAESDLMQSLRTHDSSLPISSKIDSLLDEFAGELALLKSIPPGIDENDCDFEGDIRNYLPQVQKELKFCEAKTDKSSIDEPPEVELKDLPPYLEYAFLEGDNKFSVIIVKDLSVEEKAALIMDDFKPVVQHQRRVNLKIHDVIKNEVLKLLDVGLIYPIFDSPWGSLVHCIPKKGGFIIVKNEENKLILTRLVIRWCVCVDYHKLNESTGKDHFPLPFMDQMLERLAGNEYYYFLDGFSGYFQNLIDLKDQEKTTLTCPYRTFAYRRMHFGLCKAPGTFQMCMMAIFHDMIEKTLEVFMDDS